MFCSRDEKYVALKIVKSAHHYTETAMDEIELLKRVRATASEWPVKPHPKPRPLSHITALPGLAIIYTHTYWRQCLAT